MDMTAARQGDHVRVFRQDRTVPSAGDKWFVGYIVKRGQALLHVSFDSGDHERTLEFRRSSGAANACHYYGYWYVMTVEAAEEREMRSAAEATLHTVGLQFTGGHRDVIPLPMLQALAAVVESGYGRTGDPDTQAILSEAYGRSIPGNWSF